MKRWLMLFPFLVPSFAVGQTVTNHVSQIVIDQVGARFAKAMHGGGMSGTSADIQACYDATNARDTPANQTAVSACILYDISAMDFDRAMRNDFVSRGWNDPGPASTFLSDKAFGARMSIYVPISFGNENFPEILDYFGNGPNEVSMDVVNAKP